MKLEHRKEVKIIVDYSDFEDLVNSHFFKREYEYDFVEDICGNNYSCYSYSVDGELEPLDLIKIENLKKGKIESYLAFTLLNYFASIGEIEKGNYIIQVFW